VADPAATIVAAGTRLAVGHGLDRDGETRLRTAIGHAEPSNPLRQLVAGQQEATIVFADAAASGGATIEAWRGATSNFEAYIADNGRPDQPPVISDQFRDALALVPMAKRMLDPKAIADHLLFAAVPGTHTYVTAIGRLGYGESYRWQNGRAEHRLFDPLVAQPQNDQPPLDAIDAALAQATERLATPEHCANQLSGGIDSSLLQTYLPATAPTVSGAIDSPEFVRERDYAEQASRLFDSQHRVYSVREGDYLSLLVDVIRCGGMPVRMPHSVVHQLCYELPVKGFINAQFADALFGLKTISFHARIFGQRRLLKLARALRLGRLLPPRKAAGLLRRIELARQVDAPVDSWEGLGARYAIYTNLLLAERILGTAMVRQRIEARAAYVVQRFRSEERDADPFFAHIEFGHILDFYCDDCASRWRQLAHAHGKSLLAPFVSRSVVSAALGVPRGRRYVANGRVKYLLKDLLKRRLPAFEVDAPKAGGDLPFRRYLSSGPLMGAFERYAMPDLIDRQIAAATRADPDWLTWNLLNLAIWRDEVLADPTLAPLPGTRILAPSSSNRS
jgi:asparagine synthase (glutamine-hydrolysing)